MTIMFNYATGSVGIDLSRMERRRQILKRRRWERRQMRRFQTLVADVHFAFGVLAQLRQPFIDGLAREYKLGIIWHRELRRDIAKLYIVRARLGR